MNKKEEEDFFPDWKYEIANAKEVGYLPHDCVCHISCISCGPNRVAYGSTNLSSVYYSEISTPSVHIVKLQFNQDEKMLGLEWLPFEPYHLLVISEKNLFIIDTANDTILCQTEAIDQSISFIDAHWTKNGNIISLSRKDTLTLYESGFQNHCQLNLPNDESNRKSNEGENSFCFAIDDDRLFVGQFRNVLVFDISDESQIIKIDSFVAHPHKIEKIQILYNNIVTLSDKGAVIWDKKDFVPLYSIGFPLQDEGSINQLFCADPTGTLAIDSEKGKKSESFLFKLEKGKKSDIMRELKIPEPISAAAWQETEDENEKILFIGAYGQKEFCLALIIRFTRQ